jgi:hypothetical protein
MAENGSDFLVDDSSFSAIFGVEFTPTQQAQDAFLEEAIKILDYAKRNAPWADRTGDARAGLDVDVYTDGDQVVLELFHTVEYGQWLETIQSGAFATIMPTLEVFADEVFAAAGGMVIGEIGGEQ